MKRVLFSLTVYARLFIVVTILLGILPWLTQPAAGSPPAPAEISLTLADNGRTVELRDGQVLVLQLPTNPSTGYLWEFDLPGEGVVRQVEEPQFVPESGLLGAPGIVTLRLAPVHGGTDRLALAYRRPWEDAPPLRAFTVDVQAVGSFDPAAAWPAAAPPTATESPSLRATVAADVEPSMTTLALPARFNWCEQGGCTAVRNQGNCGSCWAFGTVGPLESLIKLNGGGDKDLSEQYLVSCNMDGWGCGGGWWAHDYHLWKYRAGEPGPGAVYESDMPYAASDIACNPPHVHHEKIGGWNYVGSPNSVPSVAAIKQAIYEHGPVAAAVCVGNAFDRYSGGVFSTHESCQGTVNHGIVLVGWDDSVGAWYLRNSWGAGWGEGGYMRIVYGTSLVGFGATYIKPSHKVFLPLATRGQGVAQP